MKRFQLGAGRMQRRALTALAVGASVAMLAACGGSPEVTPTTQEPTVDFPQKVIDVVIPFDPGGGTDLFARLLIDEVNKAGDIELRPRNVPGAGGAVGTRQVAEATPDGYTVCFCTQGTVITASLRDETGYTWEDFDPVAIVSEPSSAFAVGADSPYQTMEEVIEAARANPGTLTIGTGGPSGQLAQAILEIGLGIEFVNVPMDGTAEAMQGAAGGHVDMGNGSSGATAGVADAGLVRILATTGFERDLEGVPALAEIDEAAASTIWYGVLAPAGTPQAILDILSEAIVAAATNSDFMEKMDAGGTPVRITDDPADFRARMQADADQLAAAIQRVTDTM